jgi:hypothetical protein
VNDAPKKLANCKVKAMMIDNHPRVLIYACRDILAGCELRYDYGVSDLPWRKVIIIIIDVLNY